MVVSHSLLTWRFTIGLTIIDGKHPPFLVWKYKIRGDYLLSVTKAQMAWLAALCSVCEEHQNKWILVVENLGVHWVCVCCSSSVRVIVPVGDVSLPLAGRYGYLFLSPFSPAISFLTSYSASAVFFFYFIFYTYYTYTCTYTILTSYTMLTLH